MSNGKSTAYFINLSRPTRALRGPSILTRGEDQNTMRTKGEGLSPCLLFTSATRGLLTCNVTNFFIVQSLPNPWRCILIKQLQVSLYASHRQCLFSPSHHSPQSAHLSPTSPQNFLRTLNFRSPSFNSPSIHGLFVMLAATLYTINSANGGSKLCSMGYVPSAKGSTVLATVERTDTRDVVARSRSYL